MISPDEVFTPVASEIDASFVQGLLASHNKPIVVFALGSADDPERLVVYDASGLGGNSTYLPDAIIGEAEEPFIDFISRRAMEIHGLVVPTGSLAIYPGAHRSAFRYGRSSNLAQKYTRILATGIFTGAPNRVPILRRHAGLLRDVEGALVKKLSRDEDPTRPLTALAALTVYSQTQLGQHKNA